MKFDLENTEVLLAVKREKFLLFKFAKIIKNIFLILFLISLLLTGLSILNFTSVHGAEKMLVLFLSFYLYYFPKNLSAWISPIILWRSLNWARLLAPSNRPGLTGASWSRA